MNRTLRVAALLLCTAMTDGLAADDAPTILDEVRITTQQQPLPCIGGCDAVPAPPEHSAARFMRYLLLPAEPPIPDRAAVLAQEVHYEAGPDLGQRP